LNTSYVANQSSEAWDVDCCIGRSTHVSKARHGAPGKLTDARTPAQAGRISKANEPLPSTSCSVQPNSLGSTVWASRRSSQSARRLPWRSWREPRWWLVGNSPANPCAGCSLGRWRCRSRSRHRVAESFLWSTHHSAQSPAYQRKAGTQPACAWSRNPTSLSGQARTSKERDRGTEHIYMIDRTNSSLAEKISQRISLRTGLLPEQSGPHKASSSSEGLAFTMNFSTKYTGPKMIRRSASAIGKSESLLNVLSGHGTIRTKGT